MRSLQEPLVGQGFGATLCSLRRQELPPSLKVSGERGTPTQFLSSLIKLRIAYGPGPVLVSCSHDKPLDDFAGGCADCSYIQLPPAPTSLNKKQEKLSCAAVTVAAAGWLLMLQPAGPPPRHSTLPGATLPGKNLVFCEGCSQAGVGFPSPLSLLLPFLWVRGYRCLLVPGCAVLLCWSSVVREGLFFQGGLCIFNLNLIP